MSTPAAEARLELSASVVATLIRVLEMGGANKSPVPAEACRETAILLDHVRGVDAALPVALVAPQVRARSIWPMLTREQFPIVHGKPAIDVNGEVLRYVAALFGHADAPKITLSYGKWTPLEQSRVAHHCAEYLRHVAGARADQDAGRPPSPYRTAGGRLIALNQIDEHFLGVLSDWMSLPSHEADTTLLERRTVRGAGPAATAASQVASHGGNVAPAVEKPAVETRKGATASLDALSASRTR